MPNKEPACAWIFGNSSVRVVTQGLFGPYLNTFVPPSLPTRLTALGSPRMARAVTTALICLNSGLLLLLLFSVGFSESEVFGVSWVSRWVNVIFKWKPFTVLLKIGFEIDSRKSPSLFSIIIISSSSSNSGSGSGSSNKLLYLHDRIILQYCKSMHMTIKI